MDEAKNNPKRTRTHSIDFYLSKEELANLDKRIEQSGRADIKNRSQFIREIINKGYIMEIDTSILKEVKFLLSNAANNINQIARYTNAHQPMYDRDIEGMRQSIKQVSIQVSEIWSAFCNPHNLACKHCTNHSSNE